MIHLIRFVRRKSELGSEQFFSYWKEQHAARVRAIPSIRGYTQCHKLPTPYASSSFDGVSELWLDNEEALDALLADPVYKDSVVSDEANFIDAGATLELRTLDHIIFERSAYGDPQMVKLLFALRRKPEMPPADFRHYFKDVHTRYSTKPPFQQNYWQCHVVDSAYAASAPPYDGVSQIWFADMSGLAGYFASPELGVGMEDGQRFLDLNNFFSFVGREHRII